MTMLGHTEWRLRAVEEVVEEPEDQGPISVDARYSQWEPTFDGMRVTSQQLDTPWRNMNNQVGRVEGTYQGYDEYFNRMEEILNRLAFNVESMMKKQAKEEDGIGEVHTLMNRFEAYIAENDIYWPDNPYE